MTREFIILPEFEKRWKELGLTDDDLQRLQEDLTLNSDKGDIMKDTGGLRKIRIALENRGKSGSARVCYVDFAVYERIYLITAYSKNEKDNLSKAERNAVKNLVEQLKNECQNKQCQHLEEMEEIL